MNCLLLTRIGPLVGLIFGALTLRLPATPTIITIAGNLIPTGTATNVGVGASSVAFDSFGNLYFADQSNHAIRKVDHLTGIATVIAGTGTSGFSGDGGAATSAQLNAPKGIAIDSAGNIYIADTSNHRIRKINTSGIISTIAGTGTGTFGGDNAAATAAKVNSPQGVAVDSSGNIYIADTSNNRIRKIDTNGNISTVAGNGTGGYLGDNVAATGTRINAPRGIAVDSSGNLYIADSSNNRIRKVSTGGTITTFAGTGTASFSGDNGAATSATIRGPQAITLDGAGNFYIADTTNHRIRKISGGIITTIAGIGTSGYNGDGSAGTSAKLSSPAGVAVDSSGNVYVGDTGNARVRKIDTSGTITTAAGTGIATYGGDGGMALNAQFTTPQGMAIDNAGNLYLADSGSHRVRKVDTSGNITTITGTGTAGYGGDNGLAVNAQLNTPLGIALDGSGNLYIADGNNNRIRKIDTSGIITTFAGDGTGSFGGDGGPATSAQLFGPFSVATQGGNVYIADTGNNRIRKVDTNGTITTIAGTNSAGFAGDNGPATSAQLNTPIGVFADSTGKLFITDYSNGSIRKIDTGGTITTVAGTGSNGFGGDNGPATSAQLNSPRFAVADATGNIYIADTTNARIRKVDTNGTITTLAGNGTAAFSGEGGDPALAQLSSPQNLTITSTGVLYIADTGNRRIRRISEPFPVITSSSSASRSYGASLTFTVTAANTPTSFTATGLPSGLSINSSTGAITGTPTQVGTFNAFVSATNTAGTCYLSPLTFTIVSASLTVSGVTASDKDYDRTATAVLNTAGAILNGVVMGDSVALDASGALGSFADASIGMGKSVTVSGLTLTGSSASNYTLTQPTGITATISPKGLTLSGVTATTKTYDATTAATLSFGGATLNGVVLGDTVTLDTSSAAGAYADKDVAAGKPVTVTGFALGGPDAGNYALAQPTGVTASISTRGLTITGLSAGNKPWDGTAVAPLTGTAALSGIASGDGANVALSGTAVGTFADAEIGSGKSVSVSGLTLSGSSAANYSLTLPSLSANITTAPAAVTLSNLSSTYDGAAHSATVSTTPSGLTVNVTYAGSSTAPTTAGNYTVAATVSDAHFTGSASGTLVIDAANQSITFNSSPVTTGTPLTLTATATSGLPVTFSLVSGNASLLGSLLTVANAGAVVVRATQSGNANYNAAPPIDVTFTSAKLSQTISFGPLASRSANDGAFTLTASASSGLPVTFTVTSGPAVISGSTVTPTGPGTVTITAAQAGNAVYLPASDVSQAFTVVSSGAQTYFGALTSGDTFAAHVSRDVTLGVIIGYFAGSKEAFVCNFTPASDGTFDASAVIYTGTSSTAKDLRDPTASPDSSYIGIQTSTTASATAALTFHGRVTGGMISGTILERNTAFSAAVDPAAGSTAPIAGYYIAPALDTSTGTTYSIVGTQNTVFVLAISQGVVAAREGTISDHGAFSLTAGQGVTVAGSIDATTATVSGTIQFPNKSVQSFTGINSAIARTDRLINLSSRGISGAGGASTLIAGFIIAGPTSKTVLLRAVGPALKPFGVNAVLSNPGLRLYDSAGKLLASNNGWGSAAALKDAFARIGLFPFAPNSADSAALVTLAPGGYTMHVVSSAGGTAPGVALAEVYDASENPEAEDQKLINISTRGAVGTGENILIGGFIIAGNSPKRVIIRGVGPALTNYGVSGILADPILRVYDSANQMIAMNDNWETPISVGPQTAASASDVVAAQAASGAFVFGAGSKDATVVLTLAPGAYTATVSGVGNSVGIALVEIYEIVP